MVKSTNTLELHLLYFLKTNNNTVVQRLSSNYHKNGAYIIQKK